MEDIIMKLESLKKGLFGYQKASVYRYITAVEEEFSARLIEKDEHTKHMEEQYLSKIRSLEQELQETKQALDAQKNEQAMIANTLLDAKRYATQLKEETAQKEQALRKQIAEDLIKKQQELDRYAAQIDMIRTSFANMLANMDSEAKSLQEQTKVVREAAPERNMSLFVRKSESAE